MQNRTIRIRYESADCLDRAAQTRRSDFLPERWKILHGGLPQGGEIVSEYSNARIDMCHDNAPQFGYLLT
jgi:hypothetical protein